MPGEGPCSSPLRRGHLRFIGLTGLAQRRRNEVCNRFQQGQGAVPDLDRQGLNLIPEPRKRRLRRIGGDRQAWAELLAQLAGEFRQKVLRQQRPGPQHLVQFCRGGPHGPRRDFKRAGQKVPHLPPQFLGTDLAF